MPPATTPTRRRTAAWEYAPYLCVTVKTKNNLRKDASLHWVASGRGGGGVKAAAALLIDFGNYAWQIRATLRYSPTLTCPQSFE